MAVTSILHPEEQLAGPGEDSDGVTVRSTVVATVVGIATVVGTAIVVGTRTVVGCREVNVMVERMVDIIVLAGLSKHQECFCRSFGLGTYKVVVMVSVVPGAVTVVVKVSGGSVRVLKMVLTVVVVIVSVRTSVMSEVTTSVIGTVVGTATVVGTRTVVG